MRIGSSVIVAVMNAFLAGFFLAQYLTRSGGADAAPTTWLVLTAAFAGLAIWRVRMILRVVKRMTERVPPPGAA
jgi:NO-binding membrane sensor protein with MHYT domain